MFYLFLTKKPIVFLWLFFIYFLIATIQIGLFSLVHPINFNYFVSSLIICVPFLFIFYRVFRYFCMGYYIVFNKKQLSLLGIPTESFKTHFLLVIFFYCLLIFSNAAFFFIQHSSVYFFITVCLSTIIFEKVFAYILKWTFLYELAQKGIVISKCELQNCINEVRLLFLATFNR